MPPGRSINWVEYGLEGFGLALFMLSACGFAVLLFPPASPVVRALPDPLTRRILMGAAMAATNVVNVYAPWGRRSGAHLNPVVTLTFYRLGKVAPVDAAGYAVGQFAGGLGGALLAGQLFGRWVADPQVDFAATVPGPAGPGVAFAAEAAIAFLLMSAVLALLPQPRLARYTGLIASGLVWLYIAVESPLSGMSMNPARTVASAVPAMTWTSLWLYFVAPPIGMLGAATVRRWVLGRPFAHCAKLRHDERYRCVFCEWQTERATRGAG